MKNILFIFSFLSVSALAQTPETKFLQQRDVRWAAFISDTLRFKSPNLSLEIRKQADRNQLKMAYFNVDDHVYKKEYMTKNEIGAGNVGLQGPVYDSTGNYVFMQKNEPANLLFDPAAFDSTTNDLIFAEQFLYVKKNKLLSHVSWVSPKMKVVTPGGQYLGNTLLFNTYYNTSEKISKRTRRKSILLGTTQRLLTDSLLKNDLIKQWFNEGLVKAIWPTLRSPGVRLITMDSAKQVSFANLNGTLINEAIIDIPMYDSTGSMTGSRHQVPVLNPAVFEKVLLLQEWYYNPSKKIVFNTITGLILYAKKRINYETTDAVAVPILKVVYL